MSPEAPKPDTATQTGSDKFVDIGLDTGDRARPFKQGNLRDVKRKLLKRGVPSANAIHPDTLEVDVDKIPLKKSRKRSLMIGIGSAAAGVAVTTMAFMGLSGDKEGAEKQASSTTQTNLEPGAEPSAQTTEIVDPTADIEILHPGGTAEEVLGDTSNTVTRIINNRADAGGVESDNTDLQYLTNTAPGTINPSVIEFEKFVKRTTDNLIEARDRYAQVGIENVDIAVVSTFVSSEATQDGGFVIEAVDEYWALGEDGQSVGDIISNDDPHRYTFSRGDVVLPDGNVKNTFVLTGFEVGSADPAQVLN